MKRTLAENVHFVIEVDAQINRLYIHCRGFWREETVDAYLQAQRLALPLLKPSFTVLADMREFQTLPQQLVPKQLQSQHELAQAGLLRVAELVPQSVIAKMQLNKVTDQSNMPSRQFSDPAQAELWLSRA